jgi:hypothetical protein
LRNAVLERLKEIKQVKHFAEEDSGGSCVVIF